MAEAASPYSATSVNNKGSSALRKASSPKGRAGSLKSSCGNLTTRVKESNSVNYGAYTQKATTTTNQK